MHGILSHCPVLAAVGSHKLVTYLLLVAVRQTTLIIISDQGLSAVYSSTAGTSASDDLYVRNCRRCYMQ